jgi:hypothetical protein
MSQSFKVELRQEVLPFRTVQQWLGRTIGRDGLYAVCLKRLVHLNLFSRALDTISLGRGMSFTDAL